MRETAALGRAATADDDAGLGGVGGEGEGLDEVELDLSVPRPEARSHGTVTDDAVDLYFLIEVFISGTAAADHLPMAVSRSASSGSVT
jgi:hypothetical protein